MTLDEEARKRLEVMARQCDQRWAYLSAPHSLYDGDDDERAAEIRWYKQEATDLRAALAEIDRLTSELEACKGALESKWKETVRAIYDELHHGAANVFEGSEGQRDLSRALVKLIEERHYDYFCEGHPMTKRDEERARLYDAAIKRLADYAAEIDRLTSELEACKGALEKATYAAAHGDFMRLSRSDRQARVVGEEEIARVIEPDAFANLSERNASGVLDRFYRSRRDDALTKARAILALLGDNRG